MHYAGQRTARAHAEVGLIEAQGPDKVAGLGAIVMDERDERIREMAHGVILVPNQTCGQFQISYGRADRSVP